MFANERRGGTTIPSGTVSEEERTLRRFDAFHKQHAWKVLEPVGAVYGLSDLHADAVQNMNVVMGLPQATGLDILEPLFP